MTVGLIKHTVYSMTNTCLFTTVYLLKCTWICDESYNFIFTIILERLIFYAPIFSSDNERFKPARFSISICCFHPILLSFIHSSKKVTPSTSLEIQRHVISNEMNISKQLRHLRQIRNQHVYLLQVIDEVSLCFINKLLAFHGSANIQSIKWCH